MVTLDIVIVADEHIWCLYGEVLWHTTTLAEPSVPYVGGGPRDVQQGESWLSGPSAGEGFGGSLAEAG